MPQLNDSNKPPQNNYDPRWFIWTIVFLVSSGIMLVSYIVFSDDGTNSANDAITLRPAIHRVANQ